MMARMSHKTCHSRGDGVPPTVMDTRNKIRLGGKNVSVNFKLVSLPLYMISLRVSQTDTLISGNTEDVEKEVRELGATKVTLGMIDDNSKLRKWYEKYHLKNIGYENFENSPFTVGNMECKL